MMYSTTSINKERNRNCQIPTPLPHTGTDIMNNRHKQRYKSPSTRLRGWRRAVAWRQRMGILQPPDTDINTNVMPQCWDTLQYRYFSITDYIDDMCMQGAIEYEVARYLKHNMFDWAIFQAGLLSRVDELEDEYLPDDTGNCNDIPEHPGDEDDTEFSRNATLQANINKCHSSSTAQQAEYNTRKCRPYITPVHFVHGGSTHSHYEKQNNNVTESRDTSRTDRTQDTTAPQMHTRQSHVTNNKHPVETSTENTLHHILPEPAKQEMYAIPQTHSKSEKQTDSQEDSSDPPVNSKCNTVFQMNYDNLEANLRLSRLENKEIFQTALRYVIRTNHPKGDRICFPTTEQTDRMILRVENLPTDRHELCKLLGEACARRGEGLNLDKLYKDFVRAHGCVFLDSKERGHKCIVFTRYPI